jgi:hypothetical protein
MIRKGQAADDPKGSDDPKEMIRKGQAADFDFGVHHWRVARNWQERQSDDLTWKRLTSKSAT